MGRRKLSLIFCLITVGLAGCSSSGPPYTKWDSPQTPLPLEIAAGAVTVDILGINKPLLPISDPVQQYWIFTLQLNTGVLNLDSWDTFSDSSKAKYAQLQNSAGHVNDCKNPPVAMSPNGQDALRCEEEKAANGKILENGFVVTDAVTHADVMRKQLDPSRVIAGYAWAPNSQAVAVLSSSQEYNDKFGGLQERWSRVFSYPLRTYYLDIYNIKSGVWREYMIRRNVPERGWARILGWTE
jgi:hypothetical protein